MLRRTLAPAVLAVAVLVPAGVASAAVTRPSATTDAPANVTPTSATLTGTVHSNGAATTYAFQYGATKKYGATTAATAAAGGTSRVAVDIGGLAPSTTYHFRLVVRNRKGVFRTPDRTFSTRFQPLTATLVATPNPTSYLGSAVLSGALAGSNAANRQVVVQATAFPYTDPYITLGNPQVTSAAGAFAFPVLNIGRNTQFRVVVVGHPEIATPVVTVGVALGISTHTRTTRTARGAIVRFSGRVTPARNGARVVVQRWAKTHWAGVKRTRAHRDGASHSRYAVRVRVRHGGTFRVIVESAGADYVSGAGSKVLIHAR